MGLLDQSTNNIILDAVLTDKGREFLSKNDGSFSIVKFALSDDEVDYRIIQQYGRTVGKEKIEKNTPVLEALTQGNLAQKYHLRSISNQFLIYLPSLALSTTFSSTGTQLGTLWQASTINKKSTDVTGNQAIGAGGKIPNDLIDSQFRVSMNNLFLQIDQEVADTVLKGDNTAIYTITRSGLDSSTQGSLFSFKLKLKELSTSVFNTYKSKDAAYIRTFVTIEGINSGASVVLEVQINNVSV